MIKKSWIKHTLWLALLAASFCACTDDISQTVGPLPDGDAMNLTAGQLCSSVTVANKRTVALYEGDAPAVEKISYRLNRPATAPLTLKVVQNPNLVADYNSEHQTDMKPFPAANATLAAEGALSIPAGKRQAADIDLFLSSEGLEEGTAYLLALSLEQLPQGDYVPAKQNLYYRITYRKKKTQEQYPYPGQWKDLPPLLPGATTVFYVNTETYQPLIAAAWGVTVDDFMTVPAPDYSLGHIVNLKRATVDCASPGAYCTLQLGADLSYVLEHRDKYIRHLQEFGRKVCICIENGGKGVGFCNMTDSQIADFAGQVKAVIERYHLDGVNLWDDDSKYAEVEVNTTSYPKLLKALREAMPGKLITVVDKGKATEYFYDAAKCGGIRVGEYIDYAWHGYVTPEEGMQLINPKMEGDQPYSRYTRKPIAGLDASKYGSAVVPWFSNKDISPIEEATVNIAKWKTQGLKESDLLVFACDLIQNEYQEKENAMKTLIGATIMTFMEDGDSWNFDLDDFEYGLIFYNCAPLSDKVDMPTGFYKKDW